MNNKRNIVILSLITAVCLIGDSMLYVVLPTHWREIGLTSLVQVGILLSINRFIRLPLHPLIGFFYKKFSIKTGILIAVVIAGLTTIGYGIFTGFWAWFSLRALWGLGWSLFKLGAFLLILEIASDQNRGSFIGMYNGLYRIGSLLGMLCGAFLADLYGLKVVAISFGAIAFLMIPIAVYYLPSKYSEGKTENISKIPLKLFLNGNVLWVLATGFLIMMSLEGMLTATLSHIIAVKFGLSLSFITFAIGAATIAGFIQAVRWCLVPIISPKIGALLDRMKEPNKLLVVFLFISAVLLAITSLDFPIVPWLIIMLMLLVVASILITISDTIASNLAQKSSGKVRMMTFYIIAVDLGAAAGPLLGYILERFSGIHALLWISTGIMVLLAIRWKFVGNKNAVYKEEEAKV
jgi:MFS family permease